MPQPPDIKSQPSASATSNAEKTRTRSKNKFVNVYNNTLGILDQNFFKPHNDPKLRPIRSRVVFKPGNNRIAREDWERCLEKKTFRLWTTEQEATTPDGHKYPLTMLELGKKVDHSKEEAEMQSKIDKVREAREAYNY